VRPGDVRCEVVNLTEAAHLVVGLLDLDLARAFCDLEDLVEVDFFIHCDTESA
jgi:hypothetical protein